MKAVELRSFGYEGLQLAEREPSGLGPLQVRVKVHAASLNFRDHLVISGMYGLPPHLLPLVPLSDASGEVVEVGHGVSRFKVGDRVATMMTRDWIAGDPTPHRLAAQNGGPLDGVLQEFVVLPEHALVPVPAHLSHVEAATLPIAALTAWNALRAGNVGPGKTVLLLGTGNVSLFGLQLAKLAGARAIVTTSRPQQRDRLLQLGADAVLDYKASPDWPSQVVAATDGQGADIVVEVAGMPNLPSSLAAVRPNGFIALVGMLAGLGPVPDVTQPLLRKSVRLQGMLTGSRDLFEELNHIVSRHRLRPVIDHVFPLKEYREAFDHYISQRSFGKVVITLAE